MIRRARTAAVICGLLFCCSVGASAAFDSHIGAVIVKLVESGESPRARATDMQATAAALGEVALRYGVTRVDTLFRADSNAMPPPALSHLLRVVVPDGVHADELAAAYAGVDGVEYVEPDFILSLFELPDDPYFGEQWALQNTGQSHYHVLRIPGANNDSLTIESGLPGADIHAAAVLERPPVAASTAVVAILDTGVDIDHPDLAGRLWINPAEIPGNGHDDDHNGFVDDVYGWDFSGDLLVVSSDIEGDDDPTDRHGHGTHCAGIVGAVTGNGLGIAGATPPCRIMAVKMFPAAFISVAARAIVYAADNGADVINMSWGGPWYSRTLKEALDYARARGAVLVAASGNDGTDLPLYPAAYDGVIAVSATDDHDRVTDFSTFGLQIDLSAPGQSILSLRAGYTDMYADNYEPYVHVIHQNYYLASGTSMAAPHVAAAAAWLEAVSPGLSADRVAAILKHSADDLVDPYGRGDSMPGWDPYSGAGRLNLEHALSETPAGAAQILSPSAHQLVSGLVTVSGNATGQAGETFVLDCGRGPQPLAWTRLAEGPATVTNATLTIWNTDTLAGLYTLRLRVGESHEVRALLYVANARYASIRLPAEGDTVVSVARVQATVASPAFDSYLLEYADWPESKSWHRIDSVTRPVVDGEVGTWYTGSLPDGWYRLRLTLFDDGPPRSDTVRVMVQSPFSAGRGWKVPLQTDEPALLANWGDFDRDGAREFVIATGNGVQFFRSDGTGIPSPLSAPTTGRPAHTPVAVGDLDGDGYDDLVVVDDDGNLMGYPSTEQPFVVASAGPLVESFEWLEEDGFPLLFLRDVDGDNRDEIHYFPGWSRTFLASYFVLTPDGGLMTEIPRLSGLPNRAYGAYLPADLDGDGHDELYVADTRLYLISPQGTVEASVPLSTGFDGYTAVNLSAADVDDDGKLELVVLAAPPVDGAGLCSGTYRLFAFDENLTPRAGWPRDTRIDCIFDTSLPVFGDIDGDGVQEYFITSFNWDAGLVSAWHLDGTPFLGEAATAIFATTADPARLRAPVLADLDGDGLQEVVACATTGFPNGYPYDRLYAWDHQGRVLPGWPVIIEDSVGAGDQRRYALSAGDVDGDGRIDLATVTSNNQLVFLNVGVSGGAAAAPQVPVWRYDRGLSNVAPIAGELKVTAVRPTKRQERVEPQRAWRVTFNRDLDPASIADGVVTARGSASGEHQGVVAYDAADRTLIWTPLAPFSPDDTVFITLAPDLRTPDGHSLAHGFASSFMIGAEVPAVASILPLPNAVNVLPDADLEIRFNTRLDPASIDTGSVRVTGTFSGLHTGTVRYDSVARSIVFDPDFDFVVGEFVQATVSRRIRSVWGFHLTRDSTWSFLIAYASVSSVTPAPLTVGVAGAAPLTARTAYHVDASVINDSTFVSWGSQSGRMPALLHYDSAARQATLSPAATFFPGERVTAAFAPAHFTWEFIVASGPGPARFGPPGVYPIAHCSALSALDVDGDGDVDLCAPDLALPYVWQFLNKRRGTLARDTIYTGERVHAVLPADFDADGLPDLAAVGKESGQLLMLRNLGAGQFAYPAATPVSGTRAFAAADLDADGDLDLYTDRGDSAWVEIVRNVGGGSFEASGRVFVSAAPSGVRAIDVDHDGDADLVALLAGGGFVVLANDGDGSFTPGEVQQAGRSLVCVVVGDLDRDGLADLAALDTAGFVTVIPGQTGGGWRPAADVAVPGDGRSLLAADLDGDGDLDLVSAHGVHRQVAVLLNDGTGSFAAPALYDANDEAQSLVFLDLDADGDLDLATSGPAGLALLINAEAASVGDDGTVPREFELAQNYPNPFNPATTIAFSLPVAAHVRLDVFNVLGRRVRTLIDEPRAAGHYVHPWDGRSEKGGDLPSGLYFYRLEAGTHAAVRKMMLLK